MAEAAAHLPMTPVEYLAFERGSATKHEFVRGELFGMAGATREHSLLTTNIQGELRSALFDRPCEVHSSDLRVKIPITGSYVYPDATVACGELRFEDETFDTLMNPTVIVEVLSDSTEAYDRGEKFEGYRSVPSITDYVLVSQRAVRVDHYRRDADGSWRLFPLGPGETLELASIGARVEVDRVYHKVTLPPAPPRAREERR
jgi:Uma2 family endonuclease